MNFNDIKREFRHLSNPKKAILIACVCAVIFAFFPWFEIILGYGTSKSVERMDGFSRFGIFGIISVLSAIASLVILFREIAYKKMTVFSFMNPVGWMVLSGESIYALIIAFFVYSSLFKDFSTSEFRFGIFVSVISHIIVFVSAYFIFLEERKKSTKKEFQKMSDEELAKLNIQPEVPKEQLTLGDQ